MGLPDFTSGVQLHGAGGMLCSRNDVAANVGVLAAAGGVAITGSAWPDITVGLLIALLFVTSAVTIIRETRRQPRPIAIG